MNEIDQRILGYLYDHGIAQQKELIDALDVKSSTLFRKMERMVKSGIVLQRKMGRYRYYEPSPAGYRYYENVIKEKKGN